MWANAPYITFTITVAVIAIYVTYKLAVIYLRFQRTEADCRNLSASTTNIGIQLTAVDKKLGIIIAALVSKGGFESGLFMSNSPAELTELGSKILVDIGGKKYIDDFKKELISALDNKEPKTGLDVQTQSGVVLAERTSDEDFSHIKQYIFRNPIIKVAEDQKLELDLPLALRVMSIYLRNKYFELHPALKNDL
jgi:hypothetical protein